ncbi:MAG TPA: heavy metal-binding domain-containing protein [Stellaceae bacterium]|nr:heavy metal-binding domain-containing protein [Stellaceae bacterium]
MSWFDRIKAGLSGADAGGEADRRRLDEWDNALAANRLPSFVAARLEAAAAGRAPWLATISPAELALARRKGIRPLATVSGTCWYHYGWSWTEGHSEGWRRALSRMRQEARLAGAHAVVDVRLRKVELAVGNSMDFTVLGTAIRIDGLAATPDPIAATVPALEFVRLLEAGIVPVGLAIGAQYRWLTTFLGRSALRLDGGNRPFTSAPLIELSQFWEQVRRNALAELGQDARRQGNGVLAHTHFGQLLKVEGGDNSPPRFLGRHIVIGTVVDSRVSGTNRDPAIRAVVDLCDGESPLLAAAPSSHNAAPIHEEEGMI